MLDEYNFYTNYFQVNKKQFLMYIQCTTYVHSSKYITGECKKQNNIF